MTDAPRFRHERLGQHDRADFVCSREPTLQNYLVNNGLAKRDNEGHVSAVYVLLDTHSSDRIAGYFTLSNASIVPSVAQSVTKKLNKYPAYGATKLGKLARHDDYPGLGLGVLLLECAYREVLASNSATMGLIVDAINPKLAEIASRELCKSTELSGVC